MDVDHSIPAPTLIPSESYNSKRQEPDTENDPQDTPPSKRVKSINSKPLFAIFAPPASSVPPGNHLSIKAGDAKRQKGERQTTKPKAKTSKKTKVKPADLKPAIPDFLLDPGPGGMSISLQNTRKMRQQVLAGIFKGSKVKSKKLRVKCSEKGGDPDARVLIDDPFKVICSRCEKPIPLKGPYEPKHFRDHWLTDKCTPPVKVKPVQTLDSYIAPITTRSKWYSSGAPGGGAEHINNLRISLMPGLSAQTARMLRNQRHSTAKLFVKREGLESFLHDYTEYKQNPLLRFSRLVVDGKFKDSKVFLGLVEAMILGTEREIRGVGMKNFKYQPEFREWAELVRMISPRLYRNMAQQFRMETQRIQPETYEYAAKYCKDYEYPPSHPLVLSVDDTKLFTTMQPLFDGPSKK
ncbi:hypothetical protein BDZ89DRAFT_1046487 [Hymenopellis radicata]|nr:hypothetical protein BDZ89DRAFT_1046487 [Hymenopellis radicata]